ncbi:hypothetical protein WN51_14163 [Melipona quadrifasciata]|uniref:Uncharacterized protein n=1 Tax=Melipona quadrifasciata TaxID=166423 RepID=A0A0M9A1N4_9HYME|nr:hypothetical protein WN51_14163 [Melipona quadrifasciata]
MEPSGENLSMTHRIERSNIAYWSATKAQSPVGLSSEIGIDSAGFSFETCAFTVLGKFYADYWRGKYGYYSTPGLGRGGPFVQSLRPLQPADSQIGLAVWLKYRYNTIISNSPKVIYTEESLSRIIENQQRSVQYHETGARQKSHG